MSQVDPKFSCPSCGKQYRWKPELAGRGAKCACGAKLVVPTDPPTATMSAPPASSPSPTTAAPTASQCPSCKAPMPANAILCVNCGYNFKTGKKLAAVVVEVDQDSGDIEEHDEPTRKTPK